VLLDQAFREDAHPNMVTNGPFGDITVGIAAMVGESPNPAALGCVYELSILLSHSSNHYRCTAHLVFLEHHKVKVLYALFRIFSHPLLEARWVDHVADVLVNEGIPTYESERGMKNTAEPRTSVYPPLPATQTPFSPSGQFQYWHTVYCGNWRAVREIVGTGKG
jgi:hypothetical protein